jgi:hypothetical protein
MLGVTDTEDEGSDIDLCSMQYAQSSESTELVIPTCQDSDVQLHLMKDPR